MSARRWGSVVAVATCLAAPIHSQRMTSPSAGSRLEPPTLANSDSSTGITTKPWVRPIASLIIPGTGQLMAGQERGAIYLGAEVLLLTLYFTSSSEGQQQRDQYVHLAFNVARAPFEPTMPDTVFEYFEQVAKWVESGPFDADPGPGFAPTTDEQTFNGSIWLLARETFFANPDSMPDPASPEMRRALEFYERRAIGPNYVWSWRNAGLEQDLYKQSIERSDDAFREGTQYLGLLIANHIISALDAFVSNRLTASRGAPTQIQAGLRRWPGAPGGWVGSMAVRLGF